jgi:hypothetical protein
VLGARVGIASASRAPLVSGCEDGVDVIRADSGRQPLKVAMMSAIRPVLAAALLLAWVPPGQASESCEGSYSASRLRPLPASVVLKLDRHDDSARSDRLAAAFLEGVASAGVTVRANPTVLLHLDINIDHPPLPRSPATDPLRPDLRGLQGGIFLSLPDTDPKRSAPPVHSGGAPILMLRTQLTDFRSGVILWIGDFSCAVASSSSDERIARDMGRVIGGALGLTVGQVPF